MSRRTVALAMAGGDEATFGEWDARSSAVARGLAGRGERVALLFDAARWTEFAVAYAGVHKAGGVPVLLSPGAAAADLRRALTASQAAGLLCGAGPAPVGVRQWVASVDEVAAGHDGASVPCPVDQTRDVLWSAAPLAPAKFQTGAPAVACEGPLVHGWAPGTAGARLVVATVLAGGEAATLGRFDPDGLCALAASRRAVTLGLTPPVAAALVAAGAASGHDLSSVRNVVLSGPASSSLRARLAQAFPAAEVVEGVRPPAEAGGTAPVAVSQEGMLWHEQFSPGSFNLPCLVRRYQGPLDVAALEWALSEPVRRHEPLRTTFTVAGGVPWQVAGDAAERRPLPVEDLSALGPQEQDGAAADLLAEATARPFDLATGPLFEPWLLRLGTDDHVLVVRLHHTAFDDWSVDLFRRELSALYAARLDGAPSPLPEPAVSFSDVCRRQRARLDGDAGAEERAWWRAELAGAPLAMQLPIGPAAPDPHAGEPLRLDLPPSLVAELRDAGPRLRATPYMTVLAAFSVLVARLTGQDDLLLSTVVAHRNRSDTEPLVGCFTKKVPLRLRVSGTPTFAELVRRTRTSLLGALSHQSVAFDATIQACIGPAAAAHGAVPQVAVVFQGEAPRRVALSLPGLSTGPYRPASAARRERHFSARPDERWGDGMYLGTFLVLSLLESEDGMALVARGVFDRDRCRRLLDDLCALLGDLLADPSSPVPAVGTARTDDVVDVRGFRASRPRLEAALAGCPGVADARLAVAGDRLVAHVTPAGEAPTLSAVQDAVWAALPGALWPAEAVVAGTDRALSACARPLAVQLAAMWAESSGQPVEPDSSYWQDFSFLPVLLAAREAGLAVEDDDVVRCRTPGTLAAAMAARAR